MHEESASSWLIIQKPHHLPARIHSNSGFTVRILKSRPWPVTAMSLSFLSRKTALITGRILRSLWPCTSRSSSGISRSADGDRNVQHKARARTARSFGTISRNFPGVRTAIWGSNMSKVVICLSKREAELSTRREVTKVSRRGLWESATIGGDLVFHENTWASRAAILKRADGLENIAFNNINDS